MLVFDHTFKVPAVQSDLAGLVVVPGRAQGSRAAPAGEREEGSQTSEGLQH